MVSLGEHKDEDKHEHYLRREFSYGNYQQCYTLPEDADREKIKELYNQYVGPYAFYNMPLVVMRSPKRLRKR